jgi:outer membrane protein OmpA-like peptidoglycan-associated protein
MRVRAMFVLLALAVPALLAIPLPALAAGGDCPIVPTLDNFDASSPPRVVDYGEESFRVVTGTTAADVVKDGKVCRQDYELHSGVQAMTDLEIMRNYTEGLPSLGFKITNTDRNPDQTIFATVNKDGADYWVRVSPSNGNGLQIMVLQVAAFRSTIAPLAASDCAPVPGLRDFVAAGPPDTRTFGDEAFRVVEGKEAHDVTKTGATCHQSYSLRQGIPNKTDLEIMKNYAEALPAAGFRITNTDRSDDQTIFATMTKDGVETWLRVWPSNGSGIGVHVLRIEPFRSTIVPLAANDCAPVPGLRDFVAAGPPDTRTFGDEAFRVVEGKEVHDVTKTGATCHQSYSLRQGIPNKTDLEIMKNYAEALPAAGFRITNTDRSDDQTIFATMTKDGVETWLRVWPSNGSGIGVHVLRIEPFHSTIVPLAANDCPPVPGLRDFEAANPPQMRNFNQMEFRVVQGNAAQNVAKQGKTCQQNYGLRSGVRNKTDLEIMKNYAEALPAAGFRITNTDRSDDQTIFATMTKDGVETWVRISPSNGNGIGVAVLTIEPFHSSLKAPQVATPAPPPKAQLTITAQRGGQPVAGAWCAAFAPGSVADPVGRAQSGATREVAPASYDVGCFIDEIGGTTSGWLKNQAVGAGAVALVVEMPPLRRTVVDLTLPAPGAAPETVRPEQGDFPYLPSVPGSELISGRADAAPVYVQAADAKQPELVANASIVKEYQSPPGVGLAQLLGAYHTALLRAHWSIVNEFHSAGVVLIVHYGDNGRNIWGNLHLAETGYTIIVADATIDQGKLAADLGSQCHLALTGVLFDFDKATLKPESDAVLQQVGGLMSRNGGLRLEVQGHTDAVGSDAYNQPLSEARARSVVVWLTQRGVAANRLTARGYGKTRPIASNDTDAGRAQNRRVEIADPACRH